MAEWKSVTEVSIGNKRCRNSLYPLTKDCMRLTVPDEKVSWHVRWPTYNPPYLTIYQSHKKFIDPDIPSDGFNPQWNAMDNSITRISLLGPYRVFNNFPLNPIGRTGITGRGSLERWGPNFSVHVIFTRWKFDELKKSVYLDPATNRPVFQIMAWKTRAKRILGIPGKVLFPGEGFMDAIKRLYFKGVTHVSTRMILKDRETREVNLFLERNGIELYKGYLDDPLNTDNAWIETLAMQYICRKDDIIARLPLRTKRNTNFVQWVDFNRNLLWHDKHIEYIKKIIVPELIF